MSVLCYAFGHDASRHKLQRDPFTFVEHSRCRRCGIPLIREADKWQGETVERRRGLVLDLGSSIHLGLNAISGKLSR